MNTKTPAQPAVSSILVVGTGALASLFAARLAGAGREVMMLGTWPEALDAVRRDGVLLIEANGTERAYPVRALSDPAACTGVEYALVLVKAWQTHRAARQLAVCLAPTGLALTLQNGLGNAEILSSALGPERVALGVTTSGANTLAPGKVQAGGEGVTSVGSHPRLPPLVAALGAAGFEVETVPEADPLLWGKLVINAAINPLTALLRVPNGELLARAPARQLMAAAAREAAGVAAARGVSLPYPDPVAAVEDVARRTASNRSSMLQDVERGAPTEIEAISGAIARTGGELGVAIPVTETLWRLVHALALHPQPQPDATAG